MRWKEEVEEKEEEENSNWREQMESEEAVVMFKTHIQPGWRGSVVESPPMDQEDMAQFPSGHMPG